MKYALFILAIIILVCAASCIADTHRFVIRNYLITSDKIKRDTRFVLLSDLHNKEYGQDNLRLIRAIDSVHPDVILIAGDMPDALKGHDYTPAVSLLAAMAAKYPVCYGYGNHEYRLKLYPENYGNMWDDYKARLDAVGISIMDNERVSFADIGAEVCALCIERRFYKRFGGDKLTVGDMERYLGSSRNDSHTEPYRILIAHNPEYFEAYSEWGADLTVSGHIHGGIMRLPLLGGVISPRFTLFPKYSGGEYERNGHKMIVSCGLGTHSVHVRVFNPAELAVIDIKRKL